MIAGRVQSLFRELTTRMPFLESQVSMIEIPQFSSCRLLETTLRLRAARDTLTFNGRPREASTIE